MEVETSIGFLFPILKGKETEKEFVFSFTLAFQRGRWIFFFLRAWEAFFVFNLLILSLRIASKNKAEPSRSDSKNRLHYFGFISKPTIINAMPKGKNPLFLPQVLNLIAQCLYITFLISD